MAIFSSIWDDVRNAFNTGNMVTRLMIVNFGVFVAVCIVQFALWMANAGHQVPTYFTTGLHWLCMPAHWMTFLTQPWAIFTSIFLHQDFWHVINNIIFLYWFGAIVGDLIGDRRVLPLYLIGGVTGSLLFMLSDFVVHYPVPYALGASGAVMAMAGAVLILAPDYRVMLFLLGEIKVKYIVLVMVLLDLVGIANDSNTGGHVAHIGGFAMGCFFVYRLRDGHDWSEPINRLLNAIKGLLTGRSRAAAPPPRRKPQMAYKSGGGSHKPGNVTDNTDLSFQEKLDAILDKIRDKGYDNLSQEEKEFLFQASKK